MTVQSATGRGSTSDPAVEVDGLSKRFHGDQGPELAVQDVSFELQSSRAIGLLGPNGAGKTTTIKCMMGMVEPDSGDIHIHGINARKHPREAYQHVDAMLEGARNDYWRLTVRENLEYFATINGIQPSSIRERHDRMLERFKIIEEADTPVRDLSRGMKQKVSLASALAGGADVVFLDEPTLGLDLESSQTLQQELNRIVADEEMTVLVSSHDMDTIEAVCERVIIMQDGRVCSDAQLSELSGEQTRKGYEITSPDLTKRILSELSSRFSIEKTKSSNQSVIVKAGREQFYQLIDVLQEHEVEIHGINTVRSELEDVFLRHTREESE